jgi:hypothetical protein
MQSPVYSLYSTFPLKARTEMAKSPRARFSNSETLRAVARARKIKAGVAGLKRENGGRAQVSARRLFSSALETRFGRAAGLKRVENFSGVETMMARL